MPPLPTTHSSAFTPHTPWSQAPVPPSSATQPSAVRRRIVPPSPTAKVPACGEPHTASSPAVTPSVKLDHSAPSQWRIVPSWPTAQTLFWAVPQTPSRSFVVPLVTPDHSTPFQRRIVPPLPTAHASVVVRAHTPSSQGMPPATTVVAHSTPSQCPIVPPGPTAQTSFEAVPHRSLEGRAAAVTVVQAVPSKCATVSPTAHTSSGALPQIDSRWSNPAPMADGVHPLPFQWKIPSCRIVAQAFPGPGTHSPWMFHGRRPPGAMTDADHARPSQCAISEPAAQTSPGPEPRTAARFAVGS